MVFDIPGSKIVLQKSYFLKGQVVDESKARGLYMKPNPVDGRIEGQEEY